MSFFNGSVVIRDHFILFHLNLLESENVSNYPFDDLNEPKLSPNDATISHARLSSFPAF